MTDDGSRREWNLDAAYADALAQLHSVLERNFLSDDAEPVDGPAPESIDPEVGRHRAGSGAERRPLRIVGAPVSPRGDHAHDQVPEPLVNGTRASDLFLLLRRHGQLDLSDAPEAMQLASRASEPTEQMNEPLSSRAEVHPAASAGHDAAPAVERPDAGDEVDDESSSRIPGRRTGFIPLPDPPAQPQLRQRMLERFATWRASWNGTNVKPVVIGRGSSAFRDVATTRKVGQE